MKKIRLLLVAAIGFFSCVYDAAKPVTSIEDIGVFGNAIRGDMVIAHFYYKNKEMIDPDYKYTTDLFELLKDRYDGLVHCIKINIERDSLKHIADEHDITTTPTFILFEYGKEKDRMVIDKPGQLSIKDLGSFIAKNFSKELKAKAKVLEEERKRRAEERRRRAAEFRYYYGPYDWYGHPGYYGYGWRGYYGGYYGPYHFGYGRFGGRYCY